MAALALLRWFGAAAGLMDSCVGMRIRPSSAELLAVLEREEPLEWHGGAPAEPRAAQAVSPPHAVAIRGVAQAAKRSSEQQEAARREQHEERKVTTQEAVTLLRAPADERAKAARTLLETVLLTVDAALVLVSILGVWSFWVFYLTPTRAKSGNPVQALLPEATPQQPTTSAAAAAAALDDEAQPLLEPTISQATASSEATESIPVARVELLVTNAPELPSRSSKFSTVSSRYSQPDLSPESCVSEVWTDSTVVAPPAAVAAMSRKLRGSLGRASSWGASSPAGVTTTEKGRRKRASSSSEDDNSLPTRSMRSSNRRFLSVDDLPKSSTKRVQSLFAVVSLTSGFGRQTQHGRSERGDTEGTTDEGGLSGPTRSCLTGGTNRLAGQRVSFRSDDSVETFVPAMPSTLSLPRRMP